MQTESRTPAKRVSARPDGTPRSRTPGSVKLRSPLHGVQTPNDDALERQNVRQQMAAQRQKSLTGAAGKENAGSQHAAPSAAPHAEGLSGVQVAELYKNCIKLASENKISARNTWSLGLIDHISDLVKPSTEEGRRTNFQRASCTLDAGVKIYAYRVDSVHSDVYKVMSGLSRSAGLEPQGPAGPAEGSDEHGEQSSGRKRAAGAGADPSSTLEPSFEALDVKKFDLAFTVDPLFHKTSAQFDEGGAKGLLLNNLSVFRGCEIVFDSADVPEEAGVDGAGAEPDIVMSLLPLEAELRRLAGPAPRHISPSLADICALLGHPVAVHAADTAAALVAEITALMLRRSMEGEDRHCTGPGCSGAVPWGSMQGVDRSSDVGDASSMSHGHGAYLDAADDDDGYGGDGGFGDDSDGGGGGGGGWADDGPEGSASRRGSPSEGRRQSDGSAWGQQPSGLAQGRGQDAVQWLLEAAGSGVATGSGGGWAGTSHWRYWAAGAAPDPEASRIAAPRARKDKRAAALDFENLALLPAGALEQASRRGQNCLKSATTKATLLPEDVHYKALDLAHLSLKRNTVVAARFTGRSGAGAAEHSWDDTAGDEYGGDTGGGDSDGDYDGGGGWDDADLDGEGQDLIDAPRRVEKLSISYARASKQVDVRALKETIWGGMHSLVERGGVRSPEAGGRDLTGERSLQFQSVIAGVGERCAGRLEDLSVHLCFICLLHLANEHGLALHDAPGLDSLSIQGLPSDW